jgi:WD repeat-containing protein 68
MASSASERAPKKEIYTHSFPHEVYALSASARTGEHAFRFAVGSFIEEYRNKVQVVQLDEEAGEFRLRTTIDHSYPATKVQWAPEPLCNTPGKDLLATSGDYLRLWNMGGDGEEARPECTLKNVRGGGAASTRALLRRWRRARATSLPLTRPFSTPAHPSRARRTRAASSARP